MSVYPSASRAGRAGQGGEPGVEVLLSLAKVLSAIEPAADPLVGRREEFERRDDAVFGSE
jgi:hypothetical protein